MGVTMLGDDYRPTSCDGATPVHDAVLRVNIGGAWSYLCDECADVLAGHLTAAALHADRRDGEPRGLVTLTMQRGAVLTLARLARHALRRRLRDIERSTFVPEPGKRNAAEVVAERLARTIETLCTAAGVDVASLDDGGVPRRRQHQESPDDHAT